MIVLGLTGGIGMGKTTVAAQFQRLGAKVASADVIVHRLLQDDQVLIADIGQRFPMALVDGRIDRQRLGRAVFGDALALQSLEALLHPHVAAAEEQFVARMMRLGAHLVVLDIPLLFETGAEARCDAVAVVSAPIFVQRARVLARAGMTEEKFQYILSRQMPDAEKRARADFVIHTGLGKANSQRQVALIMRELCSGK